MSRIHENLVTIIIPCYKQADLLPMAIDSCLKQTYSDVEIIVIDDGSPDNVAAVIEDYKKGNIRLIKQANKGLSEARNTGIMAAKGEFVKFLDADDLLLPTCIAEQVSALKGLEGHIAVSGYRLFFTNDSRSEEDIYPDIGKLSHALCYINVGPPHIFLYYTKCIRNIKGFCTSERVEGGHEDYDLVCRLAAMGYEAVVLHTIGCLYRQSENSMSKQSEKMRATRKMVWEAYILDLLSKDCSSDLLSHMLGGYVLRLQSQDTKFELSYLLEKILGRITRVPNKKFSVSTSISILNHISNILISLPDAKTIYEKEQKQILIGLLKKVLLRIYVSINDRAVIRINPVEIICRTAAVVTINMDINTGKLLFKHVRKIRGSEDKIYLPFYFYLIIETSRKIYKAFKK